LVEKFFYFNTPLKIEVNDKKNNKHSWKMSRITSKSTGGKAPRKRLTMKATQKTRPTIGGVKKATKVRPGMLAICEIRALQKSVDTLIPKRPFGYLVREIVLNYGGGIRFRTEALLALQEAAEAYLVEIFKDTNFITCFNNRQTITQADMRLALNVRPKKFSSTTGHP